MSEPTDAHTTRPDGDGSGRYRAFILDADETVLRMERLCAQDDDAALDLARAMLTGVALDGHAVEIWDGMRFIDHLDARSPTPL